MSVEQKTPMSRLFRSDVPHDTLALSHMLLGKVLVRMHGAERLSGRIVEVEAYQPEDPASHSFRGERPRCRSMFLAPWHAYVYRIYGTYTCFNISAEPEHVGAAVLIRALEPLEGIALMQRRRKTEKILDLTRGPGRLTAALGIGMECDGLDLNLAPELFLEDGPAPARIAAGPRIGISTAVDRPLRFYDPDSPYVSGTKKLNQLGVDLPPS